ncbi:MAG: putative lipoprotein YerB precursor [Microgenomates bacterium OLB22]|nr:MAG: putative lipoprotein YerB precursor [Microgenomates bacterium OLB22]
MNKTVVLISALLLSITSAFFSYSYFAPTSRISIISPSADYAAPVQDGSGEVTEFEGPRTEACPLNGELLTKQHRSLWETRRPMGVMIENHIEARPQSGLQSADVIYEMVAEGGITRFLSVFYCKDASYVGPIRSARVYFVKQMQAFGEYPLYVHVGGANTPGPADALGLLSKLEWASYNDLNQFSISFPTFYRDYARLKDVATEHTMYSSTAKLWTYAKDKRKLTNKDASGVSWDSTFKPWSFADSVAETANTKPATSISYGFWAGRGDYGVSWKYDPAGKVFLRDNGGKAHVDHNTDKQLRARNVIAMYVKESPANDGYPGGHLVYNVVGSGIATIFQEGQAIDATWRKAKETEMVRFFDKKGTEISMLRGNIWISIIPQGSNELTYQ